MKRVVFLSAIACLFIGCSDDSTSPDAGDAGADVDGGPSDASTGGCDGVTVSDSPGAPCGGFTPCGEGLQCSRLETDTTDGVCRQVCIPDTCESVCSGADVCVPLSDTPGTGVCAARPTGALGAYEPCSADLGYCADALNCLVGAADATSGVCLPECVDGVCAVENGRDGQCVIRVPGPDGETSYCAPTCSAAGAADECPGDMECFASGAGFVCAFGS